MYFLNFPFAGPAFDTAKEVTENCELKLKLIAESNFVAIRLKIA